MKKILCILLLILLTLPLVGCAEIIDTKTEVVEATIIDVDYDPMWFQPVKVGKVNSMITHPADYDICLKYENIEQWIDVSSAKYDVYKELLNTTIEVNLITDYYDDNTIKQRLELIGG